MMRMVYLIRFYLLLLMMTIISLLIRSLMIVSSIINLTYTFFIRFFSTIFLALGETIMDVLLTVFKWLSEYFVNICTKIIKFVQAIFTYINIATLKFKFINKRVIVINSHTLNFLKELAETLYLLFTYFLCYCLILFIGMYCIPLLMAYTCFHVFPYLYAKEQHVRLQTYKFLNSFSSSLGKILNFFIVVAKNCNYKGNKSNSMFNNFLKKLSSFFTLTALYLPFCLVNTCDAITSIVFSAIMFLAFYVILLIHYFALLVLLAVDHYGIVCVHTYLDKNEFINVDILNYILNIFLVHISFLLEQFYIKNNFDIFLMLSAFLLDADFIISLFLHNEDGFFFEKYAELKFWLSFLSVDPFNAITMFLYDKKYLTVEFAGLTNLFIPTDFIFYELSFDEVVLSRQDFETFPEYYKQFKFTYTFPRNYGVYITADDYTVFDKKICLKKYIRYLTDSEMENLKNNGKI